MTGILVKKRDRLDKGSEEMKRRLNGIKTGFSADGSCESRQERFSSDIRSVILERGNERKKPRKERARTHYVRVTREKERWSEEKWKL